MGIRVLAALLLALCLLPPQPVGAEPDPTQAVLTELFTLNRTLQEVRTRIAALQAQAEAAAADEARLEAQRVQLEQQRQERIALFGQRARYYSERGTLAPIGVLLSAGSLPEFLERLELITFAMQRDARLMTELRQLKTQAEAQERAAAGRRAEAARLTEQARAEEQRLAAEIARREQLLAGMGEQRPAVEQQLAVLEDAWQTAAMPVLESLGEAMMELDVTAFTPDSVSFTLLPPGATVRVSEKTLNRFFGASPTLGQLTFRVLPGEVLLEGDYGGVPVRVTGRFLVANRTFLRYQPRSMEVGGFTVPTSVTDALMAEGHFDIDMTAQVKPLALTDVRMQQGEIVIRAGLR